VIEGKAVPLPFNFNTIYELFSPTQAKRFEELLVDRYGIGTKIPILKLRESDNKELEYLAEYVYKHIFLNYNLKQWGLKPEELDHSVSGRVPVYLSRDNRYFQDNWQAVPKHGYTKMFERILNHKNIKLMLNTDYKEIIDSVKFDKIVFTGPIDEYFDYSEGELPYRSLKFKMENHSYSRNDKTYQEVAQMNYPNNHDYTRITEFKHITGQQAPSSTIAYEYSQPYIIGENEPYYPIPKQDNNDRYLKYVELSKKEKHVYFTGRLAQYRYYNMDETVGVALKVFEKDISKDII
jgi:UDP-galactopyranose mutase